LISAEGGRRLLFVGKSPPSGSSAASAEGEVKVLARNKRARHEYHIDETVEAGIVLAGSEVKSIRAGKVTLVDAFGEVDRGEAWLHEMDIGTYAQAHQRNHVARRRRKLLLHKREIEKLDEANSRDGYTLLPLEIYLKNGRIKANIGVCKGKKVHDKRATEKKRDAEREMAAAVRPRVLGDLQVREEGFAVLHEDVRVGHDHARLAQALHLGAHEHEAGLV